MSGIMSTATSVALMDVRRAPYVLTLPKTTDIPYRVLTVKDVYGKASFLSTITVLTQSPDVFEDGTTSKVFTNPNEITQLLAGQPGRWYIIGGTNLNAVSYNTLSSGIINAYTVCTQQLFVSSLRGDGSQLQNLAGVSTAAIFTSNTSNFFSSAIISTVAGLGSAGFISSSQLLSSLASFRSGTSTFSTLTVAELGTFSSMITGAFSGSSLTVSSINGATVGGPLFSTVIGLGSAGYISSSQLLSSLANFQSGTSTFSTITVAQMGTFSSIITGAFSGSSLTVSSINGATVGGPLFSTVIGLGSAGYVSTANLVGLVSTANLVNLVSTANLVGLVSTPNLVNLVSTNNLLGLVSTPNLVNLVSTNNLLGLVSTPNLVNLVSTNNLLGLVSTPNLVNLVSTPNLLNLVSTQNLLGLVSTPNLLNLVSTQNLLGLVSTPNLLNLVSTQNLLGLVSTPNLVNLVSTNNLLGLVSTPNLLNLVSTPNLLNLVSTQNLLNLVSTQNLLGLVSTPNLVNLVSTNNLLGLVSTQNLLNLVSTQNLQNLVSTTHLYSMLQSTVAGLGSINYISSAQLFSTTSGFQTYLSSQIGLAGNNYYGAVLYLNQSLTTAPYKTLDTTTTGASATTITNTVAAGTSQAISQFQTDDTMTPFIPNGIWNLALFADSTNPNTYLYMSLFARSGGVETLIATTITTPTDLYGPVAAITEYPISLAVPYTQTPPGTTVVLKIFASNAGSSSATVRTYYEGNTYSFLRTTFGTIIPADSLTSTVAGLGNASYLSSPQLISTVVGLGTATYISSSQLLSTVAGLGSAGYVSTANLVGLVSTPNLLNLVSTQNLLGLVSTPNLVNLVSTNNLLNLVSTQNLLGLVSTPNLVNLVSTNNLLGLVSTPNLVNLVSTNNLLGLVSTPNLLNLVSTQNLLNLVSTQNLLGLVSTPNLLNLVSTNNLLNLVSTQNLLNLVSTNYLGTQMQSTVMGLATVGYVSSTQLLSSLSNANISSMRVTGIANISTLNVSSVSSAFFYALQGSISSLQVNALTIGTGTGVISLGDIITTSISSISTTTNTLFASTATIQSISSLQMVASSFRGDGSQLQNVAGLSTVALFTSNTSNYARGILQDWSTPVSTVALFTSNTSNYAKNILQDWSTPVSTVALFTSNTSNYAMNILQDWSTATQSTVIGLGSAGYISTGQFQSSMLGITSNISSMIDPIELASSIVGLGTIGFVSSIGLTNIMNSTVIGLNTYIAAAIDPVELTSSIVGLGTMGFISSIGFDAKFGSTIQGLGNAGYISSSQLQSSIVGFLFNGSTTILSAARINVSTLSTQYITAIQGYISSLIVDSLAIGSNSGFINMGDIITTSHSSLQINTGILTVSGIISTPQLIVSTLNGQTLLQITALPINSTVIGLATSGYVSSTQLTSSVVGLATLGYVSSTQLTSSVVGLATLGYVSSTQLTSSLTGLATLGYISSTQLNSTVSGLIITAAAAFTGSTILLSAGTINVSTINSVYLSSVTGYVSSLRTDNLIVGGPQGYVTVQDLTTGTVSTGQLVAGAGFISSLQINSLSFGPTGYVIVGNFIASSLSTMKLNTQNLYTNNAYIGNASTQSAILFPGIDGTFRGTALAEQTTGAGTGELLLYKVSTATDQVRVQTTGNIVFEAGVPARSWPSTQMVATPTMYIQGTTSNVGIGTATPAATLDVVGTGRFQVVSTLAINISTINGSTVTQLVGAPIQSTVIGLGSAGYISTGQFQSSMLGLASNISSMIDPIELASSIIGLGTIGFVSSIGLTNIMNSTVIGLNSYIAAAIDPIELTSSIVGLGTMGFISSIGFDAKFGSTLQGLGTAGYISSSQLYSTVTGITVNISTRTLSAGTATISSLSVQYTTGIQGYISSLVVDSLAIGSNSGFINMGDIITTSISSLQINTGIFTASGVVSTPQLIISSINGQTIAQPIQSTAIGLATLGYISSSQLFSTVTALTGSTLSLSAGSIFVSSLQGFRISTAQATVCTVTFQDQLAGNPMGNIYQYSSILYYNSFVVAGTTAMNIQSFTF